MSKDTFKGLDGILLDQPDFIDLNEGGSEPTGAAGSKTPGDEDPEKIEKEPKGKTSDKDEDLIDISSITKTGDEDEEEDEEDPGKTGDEGEGDEDVLKNWTGYFQNQNILSEDDLNEFDGTEAGLLKAFEKREIRTGLEMVEDYKSQLPDMIKYLADNWEAGVPLNELLNIKSNQIRYENLTDDKLKDSEATQKQVYTEYLKKTTKYSDTKIEKEIARLIDLDELKDEAKDALVEMKKLEAEAEENIRKETKAEQARRIEENKKTIATYEKASKATKEVIPGIRLDEKTQEDILKKTINPIGIDGNGNPVSYFQSIRNENPVDFDLKLNYLLTITKGFTDFSKITTTAATKVTKDLTKILEAKAPKGKEGIKTSTSKGLLDYLNMPQNKPKK